MCVDVRAVDIFFMKILLTGGAGFIGSNTAVTLLEAGHEVVIIDNFSNSSPEVLSKIKKVTGVDVCCDNSDVTDICAVRRLFAEHKFDGVIHFAAFKAVGESVAKPVAYYRNNLDGLLTLLHVMAEYDVKRLIYSSSATVYGSSNSVPFSEDMPTGGCTNPYGWTKYMSEQILRDAAVADPELSVVLLRYFNPVGGHASGLFGDNPNGIPNNLMPYMVRVASGKLDKLHIYGNDYPTPDGTGVRDYIHVTDLAAGHLSAMEYSLTHKGVETVNLGSGHGISVLEMVQEFEAVNGVKVPYEFAARRPGDIDKCWASVEKSAELLHWRTEKTLADMCRDSWNSR